MSVYKPTFGYAEALASAFPGTFWELHGDSYDGLVWNTDAVEKPTKEVLDREIARLDKEWELKEYRLLRKMAYPDLGEFADALYWLRNGDEAPMLEYEARVKEVKEKYPKEF